MLDKIGSPDNVPEFIEKVKKKEAVLSGYVSRCRIALMAKLFLAIRFGHRVYRTSDPRSFIIRKTAEEVFEVTGRNPLLETALKLHDIALKDEYFVR